MNEMIQLQLPQQGRWLFLPRPWLQASAGDVIENVRRECGGGERHDCRFACRTSTATGTGALFVKGTIEHPEHAPIELPYWYRVAPRYELPI